MKLRVQAQQLLPGDIVGSGETVIGIVINSISIPTNKVRVGLENHNHTRITYWGKYTYINVERGKTCNHCTDWMDKGFRCSMATHLECDCPKCQGYCKC